MMFFSVGLLSPFGEWCDAITRRLVEQALGPAEVIAADTIEQFTLAAIRTQSPYLIVGSRQMVGRLWAVLAQANKPSIVAVDDACLALENLVVRKGLELAEAIRALARSYASAVSCAPIMRALQLRGDLPGADPIPMASAIARHFELDISDADVSHIVNSLIHEHKLWPSPAIHQSWWGRLDNSWRAIFTGAVGSYIECFAGRGLGPITWERELFFIDDEQSGERPQPASRPVDITGRPRFVVYGPNISLPPGSWTATVALGFSEEAAEMSYLVEVCAHGQLAQMRIDPIGQRFVEANLNFSIDEPQLLQVRVWNERAAFGGRLALGHVSMTPHGHMRPETRNYLATVLVE